MKNSPHGGRQGEMKAHEGTIVTSAPDVMWGTTACGCSPRRTAGSGPSRQSTTGNAECVGWHVCKVGNRFAALEPVAQGNTPATLRLRSRREVARGLALRMDHDAGQYQSDHFLNQLRYWGRAPQLRLC